MAWTYEQKFDGLTTGDLNGQDSWSGSTNYDVSTTNPAEGTKCVTITGDGTERQITRAASYGDGIFYVSLRSNDNVGSDGTDRFIFKIITDAAYTGSATQVQLNSTGAGKIVYRYNNGTSYGTLIASFTANQWYRFGFEIDSTNKKFKINVDDGSWTDWINYDITGAGNGEVSRLDLECGSGLNGEAAFDYISPNYVESAATNTSNFFSVL